MLNPLLNVKIELERIYLEGFFGINTIYNANQQKNAASRS